MTKAEARELLNAYNHAHPSLPGRIQAGYDKAHAARTTVMCVAMAEHLGHRDDRVVQFEIACLLHDIGRVGLEKRAFGKLWSWARSQGIPTRPGEWRAAYPDTPYGRETEAFLERYGSALTAQGFALNPSTIAQVEMRLGFARRLKRQLRILTPELSRLRLDWRPWMDQVVLYYYYPERMAGAAPWVRQFGEILVACEQLEAHSNKVRGRDYYLRSEERLDEALEYLDQLHEDGIVSPIVHDTLVQLIDRPPFRSTLERARRRPFSSDELAHLRWRQHGHRPCRS